MQTDAITADRNTEPFEAMDPNGCLSIRLDLASGPKTGPEKIAVLEGIALAGSISAAGRVLHLSYRRTWVLVDELNRSPGRPLIETAIGGRSGGGAVLTKAGRTVLSIYRAIEIDAAVAARKHFLMLNRLCSQQQMLNAAGDDTLTCSFGNLAPADSDCEVAGLIRTAFRLR